MEAKGPYRQYKLVNVGSLTLGPIIARTLFKLMIYILDPRGNLGLRSISFLFLFLTKDLSCLNPPKMSLHPHSILQKKCIFWGSDVGVMTFFWRIWAHSPGLKEYLLTTHPNVLVLFKECHLHSAYVKNSKKEHLYSPRLWNHLKIKSSNTHSLAAQEKE